MNCRQEVVPGHRAAGLTLERHITSATPGQTRLVLFRGCQSEINGRERGENERLHERNKQVQQNECQRNYCGEYSKHDPERRGLGPAPRVNSRKQAYENYVDQITCKNVRVETDGERQYARAGAEHFKRKNEPCDPDRGPCRKTLQIMPKTDVSYTLKIEIQEYQRCASQRYRRMRCRRRKPRK